MNILVVDDEEMVRYVLTEKLAESGFSATAAGDGQSAVELFRSSSFDAVLLDLKMPGMDGLETLMELRKHDPDVPVIMVTAFGDISTAVEAIKRGAYDFVEKPPQLSRIVVTLRRAIEKATLEREVKDLEKSVEESSTLKQAYQKLKELDQMKTAFLSSISHELRTPLTSIIGYAEINRKKLTKLVTRISADDHKIIKEIDQVEKNLGILVSEAERLTGMIDNVLDLIEMEAGTAEWKWEPVSLGGIVENSVAMLSEAFRSKSLELSVEIEESLPLVRGDRFRISQVVSHVLSNAAKFTDQGCVSCSVRKLNRDIVVRIADTGKGIPAPLHKAVFEKFRQIGETLTDKPRGVGIGLPICRMIIEYHGGTIGFESEPGKGSVFTISLPITSEVSA